MARRKKQLTNISQQIPICPYCSKPIKKHDKSKDHILPRRRMSEGNSDLNNTDHKDGILNIRICHRWCNSLKEHAGDCPGALACARAVAEDSPFHASLERRTRSVLLEWHLMYQK